MFIHGGFQVAGAGAAARANPGADHALHHIDMPLAPVAKLVINFQQGVQQLEGLLQHGITMIQHDKESAAASPGRKVPGDGVGRTVVKNIAEKTGIIFSASARLPTYTCW